MIIITAAAAAVFLGANRLFVWTVRVDIAILDSMDAATHVCSISVPVTPLNITEHAL